MKIRTILRNLVIHDAVHAKGQTLVEIIVGVVVAALLLIAVTSAISSTYSNLNSSDNQSVAEQYARDGVEYLRAQYQNNPTAGGAFLNFANGSTYCLDDITTSPISGSNMTSTCLSSGKPTTPNVGPYVRTVKLTKGGGSCQQGSGYTDVLATVVVWWNAPNCSSSQKYCHSAEVDTCLSQPS